MVITIRNMENIDAHASRVLAALASSVVFRYNKRVLILQIGQIEPVENILIGKKIQESQTILSNTAFKDSGIDALLRRSDMSPLSAKQFTDCCHPMVKGNNTFDVAGVSKVQDFDTYLLENMGSFQELLRSGTAIYDVVFIHINSSIRELARKVEEICTAFNNDSVSFPLNILCSLQGYDTKEEIIKNKHSIIISDYDSYSFFSMRRMKLMLAAKDLLTIPYDIAFKDACLRGDAISFLAVNVAPDNWAPSYAFAESVAKATCCLLGMDEVEDHWKDYPFLPPKPSPRKLKALCKERGASI